MSAILVFSNLFNQVQKIITLSNWVWSFSSYTYSLNEWFFIISNSTSYYTISDMKLTVIFFFLQEFFPSIRRINKWTFVSMDGCESKLFTPLQEENSCNAKNYNCSILFTFLFKRKRKGNQLHGESIKYALLLLLQRIFNAFDLHILCHIFHSSLIINKS